MQHFQISRFDVFIAGLREPRLKEKVVVVEAEVSVEAVVEEVATREVDEAEEAEVVEMTKEVIIIQYFCF